MKEQSITNELWYFFVSLRPKQWIKNLFIFLPLIFGKKLFVYPANLAAVLAFFLFSFAAGVGYILNDLMDLECDKHHPIKRLRPIASGKISVMKAKFFAFFTGILCLFSFALNIRFGLIVLAYLCFNFLYTKILKNIVIIDVFCLGAFFLLRIAAGTIIAEVEFSYWMIFMTVLLALFLGFNKRRQELWMLRKKIAREHRHVLAQYNIYFIDQMVAVITPSITIAYMLYTVDTRTASFFGTKHLILTVPFVYYGIFRYLYLIHKIGKDGDPTRILFHDKILQLDIILWLLAGLLVIYFKI